MRAAAALLEAQVAQGPVEREWSRLAAEALQERPGPPEFRTRQTRLPILHQLPGDLTWHDAFAQLAGGLSLLGARAV